MIRDGDVVFAVALCGETSVRPTLARKNIAQFAQGFPEIPSRDITGAASSHQNFIPHKMQPDEFGGLHGFVEVTVSCFTHVLVQLIQGIGLGEDGETQRARTVATFLSLAHFENNLAHYWTIAEIQASGKPGVAYEKPASGLPLPPNSAFGFGDAQVIDAGVAESNVTELIELPVLVAVSAVPLAYPVKPPATSRS
jgi:hypothetical protein